MIARIFRGPDRGRDVAEASRGRTFKTPFQRVAGSAEPAVNSRPTTRFARKPPEGGCFGAARSTMERVKLKLRHCRVSYQWFANRS